MTFLDYNLLTLLIFSPLIGAAILAVWPAEQTRLIKWLAFGLSLVPLALGLQLWVGYAARPPAAGGYAFEQIANWYPAIGASYHVGVDGISVPLVASPDV